MAAVIKIFAVDKIIFCRLPAARLNLANAAGFNTYWYSVQGSTGADANIVTSMGSFMVMGLFGIIIAMVVNIFVGSSALSLGISILGVFIFLGLTAFDTQKLRVMGESAPEDDVVAVRRGTIMGALTLYLDFINIFLFLLRLMGDRR